MDSRAAGSFGASSVSCGKASQAISLKNREQVSQSTFGALRLRTLFRDTVTFKYQ